MIIPKYFETIAQILKEHGAMDIWQLCVEVEERLYLQEQIEKQRWENILDYFYRDEVIGYGPNNKIYLTAKGRKLI